MVGRVGEKCIREGERGVYVRGGLEEIEVVVGKE
jgi:hypothetical protein